MPRSSCMHSDILKKLPPGFCLPALIQAFLDRYLLNSSHQLRAGLRIRPKNVDLETESRRTGRKNANNLIGKSRILHSPSVSHFLGSVCSELYKKSNPGPESFTHLTSLLFACFSICEQGKSFSSDPHHLDAEAMDAEARGCISGVEHLLCMQKTIGSIPSNSGKGWETLPVYLSLESCQCRQY